MNNLSHLLGCTEAEALAAMRATIRERVAMLVTIPLEPALMAELWPDIAAARDLVARMDGLTRGDIRGLYLLSQTLLDRVAHGSTTNEDSPERMVNA